MSEYLSKEEIKQWRSSLERITLEEYAARLGKKIEEDKPTNDLVDMVLHGQPVVSDSEDWVKTKTERITTIAQRAYDREREIAPSPFSVSKLKLNGSSSAGESRKTAKKSPKKEAAKVENVLPRKAQPAKAEKIKPAKNDNAEEFQKRILSEESTGDDFRDEVRVVFKKALTDREQKVFDHFAEHKNEIVYAKDLATLLDLPRDYVYKYIKNLRAKIEGGKLQNADKGGFILHI